MSLPSCQDWVPGTFDGRNYTQRAYENTPALFLIIAISYARDLGNACEVKEKGAKKQSGRKGFR